MKFSSSSNKLNFGLDKPNMPLLFSAHCWRQVNKEQGPCWHVMRYGEGSQKAEMGTTWDCCSSFCIPVTGLLPLPWDLPSMPSCPMTQAAGNEPGCHPEKCWDVLSRESHFKAGHPAMCTTTNRKVCEEQPGVTLSVGSTVKIQLLLFFGVVSRRRADPSSFPGRKGRTAWKVLQPPGNASLLIGKHALYLAAILSKYFPKHVVSSLGWCH